jgi:hypothetical protein
MQQHERRTQPPAASTSNWQGQVAEYGTDHVDSDMEVELVDEAESAIDELWGKSPLTNATLKEKMRCIAEMQATDILGIMPRNTPAGPTEYRQMYVCVFGALLVKKVVSKTSDSRATTPSATNMEDYMESSPITTQAPLTPLKEETWDGGIPPLQHVPGNVTVIDPAVENTLVHINAPRQTNKMDETYHR